MLSEEQGVPLDPLAVSKEKEALYEPLIGQIKPIDCVVEVARQFHGKVPLAVASGGTAWAINRVLEIIGIRSLFDTVVTNEAVTRQKPAPDIFLEAARRIEVEPAILPRLRRHRTGPDRHSRRRDGSSRRASPAQE